MVSPNPLPRPTALSGQNHLPRLVVAAPGSAHGKTTLATGLMGAFRREGLAVAGFKVGPDYIDPGYHALATGRPGRNLDPHLCSPELVAPLLLHGAATPEPADLAVVEGVMGLFDGQIGGDGFASTAHVAALIQAPVVLVLDVSHVSRTAAAVVHGLNTFEPDVRLAGVILNKAGSSRHSAEVSRALEATGLPVLGVLPRDAGITAPSRHLGLVPAAERDEAATALDRLAEQVAEHLDLQAVLRIAHAAPPLTEAPWQPGAVVRDPSGGARRPVVAVAAGRAFTFRYAETDDLLRAAGCEPVVFDPLVDHSLPAGTSGLYLGGGFPEVHATELSANAQLRESIRFAVQAGMPTVAECAGLLYLCRTVDGHPMVGAIAADAAMTDRLTLRYRTVVSATDTLLTRAGGRAAGHEFHRTAVQPTHGEHPAWLIDGRPDGFSADPAGLGRPTLHASYVHLHAAGNPSIVQRFADAVHAEAARARSSAEPDLHHHGDRDIAEGLVDLAVNVRLTEPPGWLSEVLHDSLSGIAAYPRADEATKAIAAAHGLAADQVLPTSGGAEAFTLLARSVQARRPVVVHPQFTEPEAALIAAGHRPERVLLPADRTFGLRAGDVPTDADLVMVGNPTNPTGVLHPAEVLRSLVQPGRTLVVDEAFMDAVPGEPESLIGDDLRGIVVLRSLTKTWGLAGLRAGYAVGDPEAIAAMRAQQPPWSVSTPALAAIVACLAPAALTEAAAGAEQIRRHRDHLLARLADLGIAAAGQPRTPFVLIDTTPLRGDRDAGWVRHALRDRGYAVRRGDTFPGLGPDWIRIAVREPAVTDGFVAALTGLRAGAEGGVR